MENFGGFLGAASLVLFIIVVVRAIRSKKNERIKLKNTLIMTGIAAALLLLSVAIIPTGSDQAGEASGESEEVDNKKELTHEEEYAELANEVLGVETNTEENRVESVKYFEDDDESIVNFKLNADENLTSKLMRKGILKDSAELLEGVSKKGFDGDVNIMWSLPIDGENTKVMTLDIDEEIFSGMDFDKLDYNDLPDIAKDYFEHPGF